MLDALVSGRCVGDPVERAAKLGKAPIATCKVRVSRGGETWLIHCIGYSAAAARALMSLSDGVSVALSGELVPKIRVDLNGRSHPQFDLIVSAVHSLRPGSPEVA